MPAGQCYHGLFGRARPLSSVGTAMWIYKDYLETSLGFTLLVAAPPYEINDRVILDPFQLKTFWKGLFIGLC